MIPNSNSNIKQLVVLRTFTIDIVNPLLPLCLRHLTVIDMFIESGDLCWLETCRVGFNHDESETKCYPAAADWSKPGYLYLSTSVEHGRPLR
jgi:hypothetical protein